MAKTMYLTNAVASTHRGDNTAKLNAATSWWTPKKLAEARGTDTTGTAVTATVATVAGTTLGIEVGVSSIPYEWISEPLSADFTISGTITLNLWASESSNSANSAINAAIDKMTGATGALTQIATSVRTTELGTSAAAANFTVTPTSTACNRGDRLRVRVFADDAGTMGTGFTVTHWFDRSTAAQGESFVTFTENLTFETTAPTGSTYYLRFTPATIDPSGNYERTASTTRGAVSTGEGVNTVTGPTAGLQIARTFNANPVDYFTPPLNAFTLGGMAKFNIRAYETDAAANASLIAEIAVTATDGTGAAVWGVANIQAITTYGLVGEINTTETAYTAWVAGDDISVTAGQRLRFRVYVDDCGNGPLVTGHTVYMQIDGTSPGASGDTYVVLPVAVTEQVAATPGPATSSRQRTAHRFLTVR